MPSQEEKNKGKNPMNQRLRKGEAMVMYRESLGVWRRAKAIPTFLGG
jgi:hypothetical protein